MIAAFLLNRKCFLRRCARQLQKTAATNRYLQTQLKNGEHWNEVLSSLQNNCRKKMQEPVASLCLIISPIFPYSQKTFHEPA